MKLPELPWMRLHEVIKLVVAHFNSMDGAPDRVSIEFRLARAFLYKEIETRGVTFGTFTSSKWISIPDLYWNYGDIDWFNDQVTLADEGHDRFIYEEVEANRIDLIEWLGQTTHSSNSTSPVYRSPYMALMLAAEAHFGIRLAPSPEAALIKEIEHWLREHWGEFVKGTISDSRIGAMAGLIRDPDLGKGGNRRSK